MLEQIIYQISYKTATVGYFWYIVLREKKINAFRVAETSRD